MNYSSTAKSVTRSQPNLLKTNEGRKPQTSSSCRRQQWRPCKASQGRTLDVWWCPWLPDFKHSLPQFELVLLFTVLLICPHTFEPLKWGDHVVYRNACNSYMIKGNQSECEQHVKVSTLPPGMLPASSDWSNRHLFSSEIQAAPAKAPASTHGDNAYFQVIASSQESILSLGICHELLRYGKINVLFFPTHLWLPMYVHFSAARACRKLNTGPVSEVIFCMFKICGKHPANRVEFL